jgi:hypothetical protein
MQRPRGGTSGRANALRGWKARKLGWIILQATGGQELPWEPEEQAWLKAGVGMLSSPGNSQGALPSSQYENTEFPGLGGCQALLLTTVAAEEPDLRARACLGAQLLSLWRPRSAAAESRVPRAAAVTPFPAVHGRALTTSTPTQPRRGGGLLESNTGEERWGDTGPRAQDCPQEGACPVTKPRWIGMAQVSEALSAPPTLDPSSFPQN